MMHFFESKIAEMYGVNAAVILQHIAFWIKANEANDRNYHDGYYWTYNSLKAFQKLFPYMSERQINTALKKLIAEGVIITGNYNEIRYDRTLWYALSEKGKSILHFDKMENIKMSNGNSKNVTPIPNNIPNINTDIITDNKKKNKKSEIDMILESYTENKEVISAMKDFLRMRKAMQKPATTRAVQLLLGKLDKLATTDIEKLDIINQSIERGWQGFFEIKEDFKKRQEPEMTEEERRQWEEDEAFYQRIKKVIG